MRAKAILLLCPILVWPVPVAAQSAPESLRNKSFVVNWIAKRSLRVVGEGDFRDTLIPFTLSVYVSSAGRPFSRITATPRRSGSAEAVGTSGASYSGGSRQVRFSGSTIEIIASAQSGGARRVTISVSGGACSASVVVGRDVGGDGVIRAKSLASGKAIEIRSVEITGTSCSVRDGNVFG